MSLVDDITDHINRVDHRNEMGAAQLAGYVALFLRDRGVVADERTENAIEDFVYEANVGVGYMHQKRLTGKALASAIVAEFKLNEEV